MIETYTINILVLGGIALASALVLYFVSNKFSVEENPKIDEVEALLPGINCGACGKAGCHDFATACVDSTYESFLNLFCPVGSNSTMADVANALGYETSEKEATVAVFKCQGTCENAPDKITYTGLGSCRLASLVSVGKSGCPNGCLRFGDCASICRFDALHIDPAAGIPVIDENKCTSCMACVNICPRKLFEIRPKHQKLYVACSNKQKGTIARKNCKTACIACMKCTKITSEVKVENNLSYIPPTIDPSQYGKALAETCPTKAIIYGDKQ
jgi:Na+-translocating ferredoxin:NAD+ oxidoreductase RNF subunit RnfB